MQAIKLRFQAEKPPLEKSLRTFALSASDEDIAIIESLESAYSQRTHPGEYKQIVSIQNLYCALTLHKQCRNQKLKVVNDLHRHELRSFLKKELKNNARTFWFPKQFPAAFKKKLLSLIEEFEDLYITVFDDLVIAADQTPS